MAPTKRKPSVSESTNPKRPKPSPSSQSSERSKGFSSLVSSGKETAFPRGGGTSLSAAEVKNAKAEGQREAEAALGKDAASSSQSKAFKHGPSKNKKPRTSQNKAEEKKSGTGAATTGDSESSPSLRIDHLNYKRLSPGQRVLCSVVQVRPLELIVSLPNQLLGHIPITSVSSHFTHRLAQDAQQSDSESEEDDPDENDLPELSDWFTPGQLLTAVVNTIKSADINKKSIMGDAASRKDRIDEEFRWSRRLELSLDPAKVNEGIKKEDLVPSLTLPAAVKSIEDNGYIFDIGMRDIAPFISFEKVKKALKEQELSIGQLTSLRIEELAPNGRTASASMSSPNDLLSNPPSVSALLPGILVQATIAAVLPHGLNVKFLGFFDGTVDLYHIPLSAQAKAEKGGVDLTKAFKVGKKVKARLLWNAISPQTGSQVFSMSLLPHLVFPSQSANLSPAIIKQAFPTGRILEHVNVLRVEPEFGLVCGIPGPSSSDPVVPAFVHLSRVADEHMQSIPPGSKWKAGTSHRARVVGFSTLDNIVQLSFQPKIVDASFFSVSDLQVGETVKGVVKALTDKALFVNLEGSVDAVVWSSHISDIKLKHPERKFKPGASVKGRIFSIDSERARVSLTLKKSLVSSELPVIGDIAEAKPGLDADAVVIRTKDDGAIVELFGGLKAFVPIGEVSNDYIKTLEGVLSIGQSVKIRILKVDVKTVQMVASIRHALEPPRKGTQAEQKKAAKKNKDAEAKARNELLDSQPFAEVTDLQPLLDSREAVRGIVKNIAQSGLFVSLSREVTARVQIKELFDEFVKDWQSKFHIGQEVEGRITAIDVVKSQVEMSLRRNTQAAKTAPNADIGLDKFHVGQLVRAFVKSIQPFGAFLRIENSRVSGLCHRSEVRDDVGEDWVQDLRQGDDVGAVITELDLEKNRISFSMKQSRQQQASDQLHAAREAALLEDSDDGSDVLATIMDQQSGDVDSDDFDDGDVSMASSEGAQQPTASETTDKNKNGKAGALKVGTAFNWQGLPGGDATVDSDEEDIPFQPQVSGPEASTSKTGLIFAEDKTADLNSRAPSSAADFERLLLGSPNSSLLWIQFMSFYAQASDLATTRATAQRALRTINYREQDEKHNVWLALLNLENLAGSEDSLDEAFREAVQANDPKSIHLHMLQLLERSKKYEKAEELWQATVKKFSHDPQVWQRFAQYYFRRGQKEEARALLTRSLKSLSKRQHVDNIAKFALMEFKQADPERGRTVFEGILESHPKRLDLFNIYIDMETKAGNFQGARALFRRALDNQHLSSKKAKFLLKKYLSFEKDHGDAAGVEAVKQRAAQWVAQHTKQNSDEEDTDA